MLLKCVFYLAGVGSKIYIYKQSNPNICIERIHALNGQKILGVVPNECGSKILVYGGKQLTVINVDSNTNGDISNKFIKLFEPIVCDDWLHAAIWSDNTAVLLTAHNVVQKWNIKSQTLLSKHSSKNNSILYSGLLLPLENDVLAMAGTVFSEVIIHHISDDKPLHCLKGHKGVIFSISCHPAKHLIVTTSDDRSIRVWSPRDLPQYSIHTIEFWTHVSIDCKKILYGHTARVMRSCISDHNVISVGEDSAVCHWDFQGNLLKKSIAHQNGEIWCVDTNNKLVVTGGADGGVICHPVITSVNYCDNRTIHFQMGTPKNLKFTKRKNLVILNEAHLIYYDIFNDVYTKYELTHETTYKILVIFDCKHKIAVVDMSGKLDLYEEGTENIAKLVKTINTKLDIGRIYSMHFITDNLLGFCSDNGAINIIDIKNKEPKVYDSFILPPCKERWLTAATKTHKDLYVFGDRCGNLHIYKTGQANPVQSFSKIHGRYGPTSISTNCSEIITTGRDGTIKYFAFSDNNLVSNYFKYMHCKDLEFEWIETFLGSNSELVCGFRERLFIICDLQSNTNIVEIPCGGGHRSWDIISYNNNNEEFIQFVYIKNSNIITATIHMSRIRPVHVIDGWHSKEINCLKTFKSNILDTIFYVSGSEDTTLRITESSKGYNFRKRAVFKKLSSVKALCVYELDTGVFLVLSAGGRAQICIKTVSIASYPDIKIREEVNYMIKGTDKERKGDKSWRECTTDFDPETRVMDIDLIKHGDIFHVFVGCSDAVIRIFTYNFNESNRKFKFDKEIKYHKTCILKTKCLRLSNHNILVICTSRGEVTLWDITDLNSDDVEPFFIIMTNKSGINSFSFTCISDIQFLIATGGDDNAIHLNLLKIADQNNLASTIVTQQWTSSQNHSSQITGLCFLDRYLLSVSVDQRVTLFEWKISEDGIQCNFLSQHWTDIADVHGLDLIKFCGDSVTICVFGKGMEVLSIPIR
ncbi:hypothetical protein K1T71_001038 [Dendrolimus kikuchii]|uniref:Uncharacterized protein n=1 Tax=Dendrolimus kikuchii TaxID=765133 RepID=A0ACC1DGP8_9NEOP|nr:hypothetical protein K1T71_001038 [Dendrolimus kikuchii]